MTVPDAIEEVVGYRRWKVSGTSLHSTGTNQIWTPGVNEAVCVANSARETVLANSPEGPVVVERANPLHGLVPSETCNCGFWLLPSIADVRAHPSQSRPSVSSLGSLFYSTFANIYPDRYEDPRFIYGRVKGWGRTVVGSHGWRCEYAEITALITAPGSKAPADGVVVENARKLAETYGVVLEFAEELRPTPPPAVKPSGPFEHLVTTYDDGDLYGSVLERGWPEPKPKKWWWS